MRLTLQKKLDTLYTEHAKTTSNLTHILASIALMALCSQVSVPWYPVPFTLQTLSMMFIAYYVSPRQAFLSFLGWIMMGTMGFPFFASFSSGPHVIWGLTGGYLWGMVIIGSLLSVLLHRSLKQNLTLMITIFTFADILVLIIGAGYLGYIIKNFPQAWQIGAVPFFTGSIIKSVIAASSVLLHHKSTKK